MRHHTAAALFALSLSGCAPPAAQLIVSARAAPPPAESVTAASSVSTSITSATSAPEQLPRSSGSPLPLPKRAAAVHVAPPTSTSTTSSTAGPAIESESAAPEIPVDSSGGHVGTTSTEAAGWRTLDGSCTVTDAASAATFGFTADSSCIDPAIGLVPAAQWHSSTTIGG